MFRWVREAFARLLSRPRSSGATVGDWDLTPEVRTPDPYVLRLPSPYDARWRRWAKRCRVAGHYLPFPCEETCWQNPDRCQPSFRQTDGNLQSP